MESCVEAEVRVHKRAETIVLTLFRPQHGNSLTTSLVDVLADCVESAVAEGARAIVLTGAPPFFCAGGDLAHLKGVAEHGARAVTEMIYHHFHRLLRAIADAPIPVIAAVNGPAVGAGLDLAALCDLRVASDEATFASSWINVGLIPGMGGAIWLTGLVGGSRAAQLILTGQTIDAITAERWNLINEIVAPSDLLARSLELAADLASLPTIGLAESKAALRRALAAGATAELAAVGAVQGGLLTEAVRRDLEAHLVELGRGKPVS
jgi:2-(1,2-epoxy-1,2-dihydrophenyl)acetyl-CoA isomerase